MDPVEPTESARFGEEIHFVGRVTRGLFAARDLDEGLREWLSHVARRIGVTRAQFTAVDPDGRPLRDVGWARAGEAPAPPLDRAVVAGERERLAAGQLVSIPGAPGEAMTLVPVHLGRALHAVVALHHPATPGPQTRRLLRAAAEGLATALELREADRRAREADRRARDARPAEAEREARRGDERDARLADAERDERGRAHELLRRSVEGLTRFGLTDDTFHAGLVDASEALGAAAAALARFEPEGRAFRVTHLVERGEAMDVTGTPYVGPLPLDDPAVARAWEFACTGDRAAWDELAAALGGDPRAAWHRARGHRSAVLVALGAAERPWGFAAFAFSSPTQPADRRLDLARALVTHLVLATELRRHADAEREAAVAREREEAADLRAAELAQANDALRLALNVLAETPGLERFVDEILTAAARALDAVVVEYWRGPTAAPAALAWWVRGAVQRPAGPDPGPPPLRSRAEDALVLDLEAAVEAAPARAWYRARGAARRLLVPLVVGAHAHGALAVWLPEGAPVRDAQVELARALASQAALAVHLAELTERATRGAVIEERNRMARDIHDTLAQGFVGVIMQAEAAVDALSHGETAGAQERLRRIAALARDSLAEARRSMQALRPLALERRDLPRALEALLASATRDTPLAATLSLETSPRPLPAEVEDVLLRVTQEALTNALRHARAARFQASLRFADDHVELRLRDDGRGFDPAAPVAGAGLLGMRERVDLQGGLLRLDARPGQGCAIFVRLPLRPTASTARP